MKYILTEFHESRRTGRKDPNDKRSHEYKKVPLFNLFAVDGGEDLGTHVATFYDLALARRMTKASGLEVTEELDS